MSQARIWLIGGTQESAELARSLVAQNLPCLVTVTTESARCLYPKTPDLTVWVGRLDAASLPAFLQTHSIAAILDASHPFATEISHLAIAIASTLKIPYLRFERLPLSASPLTPLFFPTLRSLLATDLLLHQRILLTLGYRSLELFTPWQEKAVLFARILPSIPALQAAISAGFATDRLIALRPPISAAMERALWQQWQVSVVVTKASGVAGGEDVKQQVAADLGVTLVVIERPPIAYPQQTSDFSEALQFCDRSLAPFSMGRSILPGDKFPDSESSP
ncbi:MAG: cobalt-precorrin-6A reductase [Leptolyngbyaceae cyanobacterium bins.302]|nr:cobalt-precorrin-6A reductase [Leptolyngbyaceae cyanobacterium bins.302]